MARARSSFRRALRERDLCKGVRAVVLGEVMMARESVEWRVEIVIEDRAERVHRRCVDRHHVLWSLWKQVGGQVGEPDPDVLVSCDIAVKVRTVVGLNNDDGRTG